MNEEIIENETAEETETRETAENTETAEQPESGTDGTAAEGEVSAAQEDAETIGNIKISVDVVSTIAGIAATGIEGVSCMYTTFADGVAKRFGAKKTSSTGVKVIMNDASVNIDLYIVVEYGIKIPELAWTIQECVKSNVENMTGLSVEKVNIHIEGINFPSVGTETETKETAE